MSRGVLAAHGTTAAVGTGDWRHEAACLDHDAELFFPIGITGPAIRQTEEAVTVCMGCPVRSQCLQYAVDNHVVDGVWGGMGEHERQAYKRRLTRARAAAERAGQAPPRDLPSTTLVPAVETLRVITACREQRMTWPLIAELLGTSVSTCTDVYRGTRLNVARALEDKAQSVADLVGA